MDLLSCKPSESVLNDNGLKVLAMNLETLWNPLNETRRENEESVMCSEGCVSKIGHRETITLEDTTDQETVIKSAAFSSTETNFINNNVRNKISAAELPNLGRIVL